MPSALERAFGKEGKKLVALLRQLLPFIVMTKGQASNEALNILNAEADRVSEKLVGVAKQWASGPEIKAALVAGQKAAAAQLGTKFGGVNTALLNRLTLELERRIIPVAASPRQFVDQAVRKAQAAVIDAGNQNEIQLVDQRLTESLIKSTLRREAPRQMGKAILKELGLAKGDRILLSSGRTMEASAYSNLIARTRTQEAVNLAKAETYSSEGVDYIKTSSHSGVDSRDICSFLQGKVWALKENDRGIPVLPKAYGLPPWHPNCRHTFTAWQPEFQGGTRAIQKAAKEHEDDLDALDRFKGTDGNLRPIAKA